MQNEYEYLGHIPTRQSFGIMVQDYHVKGCQYMHGHHTKQFKVTCSVFHSILSQRHGV